MAKQDDDVLLAELWRIGEQQAATLVLTQCPNLLALLRPPLVRPDMSTTRQAEVLRYVLLDLLERAYRKLVGTPRDEVAQHVMAAGAWFGLVPEPPEDPLRAPSEMTHKASGSSEVRQDIAAQWLPNRQKDRRGFRRYRGISIATFRDELLDWLQNQDAIEGLARHLDIPAPLSQTRVQETEPPTLDIAATLAPNEREPAIAPASEPGDGAAADDGPRRSRWSPRRVAILGMAVAVITTAIVIAIVLSAGSGHHAGSSTTQPPPSGTPFQSQTAASGLPLLTFDALGGGSTIIRVFPGVYDRPRDKVANGTFKDRDTIGAVCKTGGRTVISDTNVGERARQSKLWIRIAGSPGKIQYATMTYADIAPAALDALPSCTNVS